MASIVAVHAALRRRQKAKGGGGPPENVTRFGKGKDKYKQDPEYMEPLEPWTLCEYLVALGYDDLYIADQTEWESNGDLQEDLPPSERPLQLQVHVNTHVEVAGHTHYCMDCSLTQPGSEAPQLMWRADRRLGDIRSYLLDPLEREFGRDYAQHFEGAPFALRGGLPGTTARLNTWFERLSSLINVRKANPTATALTMRFLGITEALEAAAEEAEAALDAPEDNSESDLESHSADSSEEEDGNSPPPQMYGARAGGSAARRLPGPGEVK
eukprot:gnl/TRDRNA2_/TRDRNA2_196693_c0_seq1.p1 gnl/TRDRNA2_/TRDRNA2_196693_c0~~gnl/TRDRNA2_/TRDRNA2_196693_c0_seq1.p1  ORF type:complete len:301 (-),score=47.46 gnl/TRDRNA2_/TRDRNA2_196693_c0_seq1:57-863(-)